MTSKSGNCGNHIYLYFILFLLFIFYSVKYNSFLPFHSVELTKLLKSSENSKISKLQKKLEDFASKKNYSMSVQSMKTKQWQKKVVAKTFHGLGIVVPVVNDIGYRPLPESNGKYSIQWCNVIQI